MAKSDETGSRPEQTPQTQPDKLIKRRRKGFAAPLGCLVIVLAVVGFFALISAGTQLYYRATDDTAERASYSTMLNPIVMLDPPNFSDPSKLSSSLTLQTTIWTLIMNGDASAFPTDESGRILIPVSDLEVCCAGLYGGQASIVRATQTADGSDYDPETADLEYDGVIFEYVAEQDCFAIPVMGEIGEYNADVTEIARDGGTLYLTVGYKPINGTWYDAYTEEKTTDVAEKYKIFVLKKQSSGSGYYVYALQNADIQTVGD